MKAWQVDISKSINIEMVLGNASRMYSRMIQFLWQIVLNKLGFEIDQKGMEQCHNGFHIEKVHSWKCRKEYVCMRNRREIQEVSRKRYKKKQKFIAWGETDNKYDR